MLPSRPVNWLTPEPVIERVRYPVPGGGSVQAELYRPGKPGPHPGVVVCLGVVPFEVDHPQVPRLGETLARAGFAALLYWSPAMRDVRLDPADIDGITLAYRWLTGQPAIDPARSGLLGTCVGGSFALLAAAHPAIRDRVAFTLAWAPYASMATLARDIASASCEDDGARRPWAVDQLTRKVFVRTLTAGLPPDEAERLRAARAGRHGLLDPAGLSAEGLAVLPLLTGLAPAEAEAAVEALPGPMRARMAAMSPLGRAGELRAPLLVIAHDRDDAVIPIGESRRLVAALRAAGSAVRFTEFTMFQHLDPTKVKLSPISLAKELLAFYRMLLPSFRRSAGA